MNAPYGTAPGVEAQAGSEVDDPLWYRDAIIYQLHIKAFLDSNNDGIGDFAGLISKLDYIQSLGVTAIWVLPFYPSPLRDDGYDISDYRRINPSYGSLRDFNRFVEEAHRRNLRVITELVINHTSDQHPWFQRARKAKPGMAWRNFYVWSDDDKRYAGTRIIFLDTEKSNWTWDQEAQAYYWHRFYSHQPDLNFDNPRVFKEVTKALHFWLERGVDGLRLDAVPYLIEREGTSNENLPETHEVLKRLRAVVDEKHPNRMLLAEANQWPEDTCPYFGEGDECHMAFHFPLMPRMYMALAQEDRHPITDIIRQTPEIPENCQWAVFLRNHDELTLEMVTDRERDYLWETYATDRRARLNLGIRRRLAPLLENDRRKIELLNGLLMSMPGTPIIYYGDEIGMGDNIYLGDRDGVRTPMQWSPDRNGGFSRANPQNLYLPPIMDPVYGYETVNVEAQQASPSSLLNWMRRLINVRTSWRAFGRGSLTLLYPRNRKILAYLREYEGECILCVANMSRTAQAVELDLQRYSGRVPIELLSRSPFPPVGELPYLLTLAPYGFYWFSLEEEAALPSWHIQTAPQLPEFSTIVVSRGLRDVALGRARRTLEDDVLPMYLRNQRWFSAESAARATFRLACAVALQSGGDEWLLAEVEVARPKGESERYFVPLALTWGEETLVFGAPLLSQTLARVRRGSRLAALHEAVASDAFARACVAAMRDRRELDEGGTSVRFCATPRLDALEKRSDEELGATEVRPIGGEQSNTTVLVGDLAVIKFYRRLRPGLQPELEIARFLTETAAFEHSPALLGWAERTEADAEPTTTLIAFAPVSNQGDAWRVTLEELDRVLEEAVLTAEDSQREDDPWALSIARAGLLGRRTAELHQAFATPTSDAAFASEPITAADVEAWVAAARRQVVRGLDLVEQNFDAVAARAQEQARWLLDSREAILAHVDAFAEAPVSGLKMRTHGDYHLGQVLIAKDDVSIIDFEGEPRKSLAERRRKTSPLRDVAGMLRSFDYAAWTAFDRFWLDGTQRERALTMLMDWRSRSIRAFLDAYAEAMGGDDPEEGPQAPLLTLFLLEKAFYEIEYEAAHRQNWLHVPVLGAFELLKGPDEDSP